MRQDPLALASAPRPPPADRVSLVYYAMSSGGAAYLPAASVVSSINGNAARASVVLGYSVDSPPASVYDTESAASSSRLWVIGAVFGSLGALLLIVWAVLFAYYKCLRPYEPPKYIQEQPGFPNDDAEFFGYVGDGKSLGSHGAAKPRWGGVSGAPHQAALSADEMEQLADRVAERLDRQVARLLQDGQPGRRRLRQKSRLEDDDAEAEEDSVDDEEWEAGGAARTATSSRTPAATYELPDRPLRVNASYAEEGVVVDEEAVTPRRQRGVSEKPVSDPNRPVDKSTKRHEAAERKRNKKRLRRRVTAERQAAQVAPSAADPIATYDTIDAPGGIINDGLELDPALVLPVPNSPDPTPALPQLVVAPAKPNPRSPYATGDAVARIMPYLETDREKHFNLSERDLLAQAELHHRRLTQQQQEDEKSSSAPAPEPSSPGRSVLISVEPQAPNPNSDEWDVIRDSAAEDSRVSMLSALRREARAMGLGDGSSMV